jgi:hypothetical protein
MEDMQQLSRVEVTAGLCLQTMKPNAAFSTQLNYMSTT